MVKVRELINNAYYLSNIIARGIETATGPDITDGLKLLNRILAERNLDSQFLPFYNQTEFPGVIGQEEYWIPGLMQLEVLTVNLDNVRYPMYLVDRDSYFGDPRVNNINSIPYSYYSQYELDQETGEEGTRMWVYWKPSQTNFIFQVTGRFGIASTTLEVNITNILPLGYVSFLEYELSKRLCHFRGYQFDPDHAAELAILTSKVDDVNPIDTTCRKMSPFGGGIWPNFGQANLGHWWVS